MPRNVVTLVPRLIPRGRPSRRQRIEVALGQRFRFRRVGANIEIDFPTRLGKESARDEVIAELDRIDRRWRRFFVLYPR
jgi:hypothetical protein